MPDKRVFLMILASAVSVIAACRPAAAPVAVSNKPASINGVRQPDAPPKPVSEMSWTDVNGTEQKIADHSNKVLILDFWATYCSPCRDEIPHLNSLQAKYGADKLLVVGLNVGGIDDRPKIPAFINELMVSYPIGYPEDALLSYVSGDDDRIPQTAVFDGQGRLIVKVVGFDPNVQSQLDRAVELAISQN